MAMAWVPRVIVVIDNRNIFHVYFLCLKLKLHQTNNTSIQLFKSAYFITTKAPFGEKSLPETRKP